MEIVYGIAGVLSLGLFAAFAGLDFLDLGGKRTGVWTEADPNSTLGVTRDVLAEQGESWRMNQLGTC